MLANTRMLLRRSLPHIVEGIVGPTVAFLLGHHLFGLLGAISFAFAWATLCLTVHLARGRRISGLLLLALINMVLRTVAGVIAHSSTVYFLGPDIATAGMGIVFIVSALAGRPLLGRVLADLVPPEWFDPSKPEAARLCRLTSLAWGVEQLVVSGVTAYFVFHLSATTYVATHEFISLATFGLVMLGWLPILLPEVRMLRRHTAAPARIDEPASPPMPALASPSLVGAAGSSLGASTGLLGSAALASSAAVDAELVGVLAELEPALAS